MSAPSVSLSPTPRHGRGFVVGHTGFNVARYNLTHALGTAPPLLAGVFFFGWRAAVSTAVVVASVLVGTLAWRRVGPRGHLLRPALMFWLGILLAAMLPAQLLARRTWPVLPAAGLLLVGYYWVLQPKLIGRIHPVLPVFLALSAVPGLLPPGRTVLQRTAVVTGDGNGPSAGGSAAYPLPWRTRPPAPPAVAWAEVPVAEVLTRFTRSPGPGDSIESLLRDRLPPMEDVLIGATPGGVGTTSVVALLIAALFLLYRGLIDWRIAVGIGLTFWVAVLLLPGRYSVDSPGDWIWAAGRRADVSWPRAVTLANYEMLGTPLPFAAIFLAGSPVVRPIDRRARIPFAVLVGLLAAGLQLYLTAGLGAYLAVLFAGPASPWIDRRFGSRPLV